MQQAALSRRERQIGMLLWLLRFCCSVFCLRKSARSAGYIGVSSVRIDRVRLCVYSPADYADYAEECSGAALYRRERHITIFELMLLSLCLVSPYK